MTRAASSHHPSGARRSWRGYAALLALVAVLGAIAAIIVTHERGGASTTASVAAPAHTATAHAPVFPAPRPAPGSAAQKLVFADSGVRLPGPRQAAGYLSDAPGEERLIGGENAGGVAVRTVLRVTTTEASASTRIDQPLTGAAAASVSGTPYAFGGEAGTGAGSGGLTGTAGAAGAAGATGATGAAGVTGAAGPAPGGTPTADIVRIDPTGAAQTVDQLPTPVTGAGAATVGANAYIVGGFDGRQYLRSVVAWQPGVGAHIVAELPQGVSNPAVAVVGGQLVIAGGTTARGPSRALLGFDPSTNQVAGILALPGPLTHAAAVTVGGRVYLLGGQTSVQGTQTDAILQYDPTTARVAQAGRLPTPLSDMAAVTIDSQVLLAGGIDDAGTVHREVWVGALSE